MPRVECQCALGRPGHVLPRWWDEEGGLHADTAPAPPTLYPHPEPLSFI